MLSVEEIRRDVMLLSPNLRPTVGRRLIERHAPELLAWWDKFIGYTPPPEIKPFKPIEVVPEVDGMVQTDPELIRIAYRVGLFPQYRVWLFASRKIGNGCGWLTKNELYVGLKACGVDISRRSLDRYLQQGMNHFWTYDSKIKRVYLKSAEKVSILLSQTLIDQATQAQGTIETVELDSLETNAPGRRRVLLDLSGTIGQAAARAYEAWFASKDLKGEGVTISRELLAILWGVAVSTMLEWEAITGMQKTANYAQQSDASIENVPSHAYLCLDRYGVPFASWQLPNTYQATQKAQRHSHTGNARRIRQQVERSVQPALNGDGGMLRTGKLYFADGEQKGQVLDGFARCDKHLRKHKDVFMPHYFKLGKKNGVILYERFDIQTNKQETSLNMRNYKAEEKGESLFHVQRFMYAHILAEGSY